MICLQKLIGFKIIVINLSHYVVSTAITPAGTWRLYNVGSTSMQRHDVASTLRRRCIYVICLLGTYNSR